MSSLENIASIRRQYGDKPLDESNLDASPFELFKRWLNHELSSAANLDPTAMVLSTSDAANRPDSRVVLLKDIIDEQFIFYTNYGSSKAQQITANSQVALNFHWPLSERQVRIRGIAKRTSTEQSDSYFSSRPFNSQLSALVSVQSHVVSSRQELEDAFTSAAMQQTAASISRPEHWGGYMVFPQEIEFWQGRDDRLHDRIKYFRQQDDGWMIQRLAP